MTSRIHHFVTATIALGIGVLTAGSASALTTQQVAEKLAAIPVYTMGLLDGNKVTFLQESITAQQGGQEIHISRVYMNPQDAQKDLDALKSGGNTQLPANVSVAEVSLGEVYCISQQNQPKPTDRCDNQAQVPEVPPSFVYFPDREQLTQAVSMLKQQGVQIDDKTPLFVPLFLAQFKPAGKEPRTAPAIYFSVNNLQSDIAAAKANKPQELANVDISVQVTTLGRVLEQLKAQNDPALDLVQFVPLRSSTATAPTSSTPPAGNTPARTNTPASSTPARTNTPARSNTPGNTAPRTPGK